MNGRQYVPANGSTPQSSTYNAQTQQEAQDGDASRSHVRDLSGSRGRGPVLPNIAISNIHSQQANAGISSRSQSSASTARSPASINGTLERRPSATQGHYRQQSRAHSNFPQSRNGILVTSPTASPLSPETPNSASTNASQPDFSTNMINRRQASVRYPHESTSTLNSALQTNLVSVLAASNGDREAGDTINGGSVQKRNERSGTSKSRSGHHHHRSQSKQRQEQKSVGEYALHHLFNKVGFQSFYIRKH